MGRVRVAEKEKEIHGAAAALCAARRGAQGKEKWAGARPAAGTPAAGTQAISTGLLPPIPTPPTPADRAAAGNHPTAEEAAAATASSSTAAAAAGPRPKHLLMTVIDDLGFSDTTVHRHPAPGPMGSVTPRHRAAP